MDADGRSRSPRRAGEEVRIYGRNAVRALFERRPGDLVRVWIAEDAVPLFRDLLKECALRRRAYHVVPRQELDAVAATPHHEGICVIARRRREPPLDEVLALPGNVRLAALENVGNPYNLGAILRVCAHFGVSALLVQGAEAGVAGVVARVAEGGAEWVPVVRIADLAAAVPALRSAGFRIVATTGRSREDVYGADLPQRAVVLLGSEGEGLSRGLLSAADLRVSVPGTGHVESLNVAAAAAVVLGEMWRRRTPRRGAPR
ncbi:rRNA methyltransferase [Myxococcota bacterium]|nr:rRNA methyltransferase [Myxococcota bacterium]